MTVEDIQKEASVHLEAIDTDTTKLHEVLEYICTGNSSIGELDDAYKVVKQHAKALNKLAKEFRKIKEAE